MPENVPFLTTPFSLIFPLNIYDGRAANHANSFNSLIFDYRYKSVYDIKKKCESHERQKSWNKGTEGLRKRELKIVKKMPKCCMIFIELDYSKVYSLLPFIWYIEATWHCIFFIDVVDIVQFNPIGPIISIRFLFIIHLWFMKCGTSQLYLNNLETNRSD